MSENSSYHYVEGMHDLTQVIDLMPKEKDRDRLEEISHHLQLAHELKCAEVERLKETVKARERAIQWALNLLGAVKEIIDGNKA